MGQRGECLHGLRGLSIDTIRYFEDYRIIATQSANVNGRSRIAANGVAPGRGGFVAAMVAAQVLTQIGAFTLPALLPGYIERWSLSKTEAGWLVGIFFAAYVPAVPVLLALTDRVPARRVYLVGTGLTALSHLGFARWPTASGPAC